MEEVKSGGSLSISKGAPRRATIPAGPAEAEYIGFEQFMDTTPWGEKETVRFKFKLLTGPGRGSTTSCKAAKFLVEATGDWVIGGKSNLAKIIRKVSGGKETLSDDDLGRVFIITVSNGASKSDPEKTYDFLKWEDIVAKPVDASADLAAAVAPAAVAPAPAAVAPAPAAVAPAPAAVAPAPAAVAPAPAAVAPAPAAVAPAAVAPAPAPAAGNGDVADLNNWNDEFGGLEG